MHATDSLDSRPVKPRWYHLTPDRLIVGLPVLVGLLWISQRGRWFSFTQHKGWAVLIAVAVVLTAMVLMALGFLFCLLFRRRFQFSLRSLLVFTVTVALVCSWLAVEMKQAREQRELIKAMGERAWVYYDWKHSGPSPQPPEPMWLRNLLGNDFFDTVVRVGSDSFTDDGLQHLKEMTQLQGLCLSRSPLTGAGLRHLEGMAQLESLELDDARVTDTGLQHLKVLTQLKRLALDDTQVTDAGLQHIEGIGRLEFLSLNGTRVTDVGLQHLKGMSRLKSLWLDSTRVTDVGLQYLAGMAQLETLDLTDTQVTDAGLQHLKGMTRLEFLSLTGTQVTDAGLRHLKGLSQLQEVELENTKVTDEGVKNLRQALPNCRISM